MLGPYNIILVVARIYPLIVQIISFLMYFINLDKDFIILGITMILSEIINGGLKNLVCKPLMGNKYYPIIGLGRRPDGANNCGLYYVGKDNVSTSYGMPSGHSQNSAVFSTFMLMKILDSDLSDTYKTLSIIFFPLLLIYIMWSRVYLGCHTIQQTIIGSSIGIAIGYYVYNYFNKKEDK